MASGNAERFAKLRQAYGPTMCEACKRIFNEHSDDELIACLRQRAAKNRALKKAAGEPVPPVDPEELKSGWKVKPTLACGISQEAKIHHWAVSRREGIIRTLERFNHGQLLTPWKRGDELDDAVFRIAARFPMRVLPHRVYRLGGEEIFGYDPNAFVQQLVEETGISHTWEPLTTRVPEGHCTFSFLRSNVKPATLKEAPYVPFYRDEHEAKRCTREVLWDVWEKYYNIEPSERISKDLHARLVAGHFADFVIDNSDLAQQLMSHFSGVEGAPQAFAIVTELEQRAMRWRG